MFYHTNNGCTLQGNGVGVDSMQPCCGQHSVLIYRKGIKFEKVVKVFPFV